MEVRQALGGRYKLLSELGSGGMAVVWRAHDEVLGRPVAVKLLAGRFAGDPQSRARIRHEARAAAALSHPNIAQVYDYGESDEDGTPLPYVVMELINGPTLQQRVASAPLPPRTIFRICGEVAAALAAAHADGLVHRDIKMANIMVTPGGAKVVDFGIAAAAGPAAPEEMLVGTPAYLAPERLTGGAVVPASDVYALGVLLYRLLAHESPWSVESTTQMLKAHVYVEPTPLPAVPGVPPAVADLIDRCLRKDPADRPTATEVSATLGDAAEAAVWPDAVPGAAGATLTDDELGAETAWEVAPGGPTRSGDTEGRRRAEFAVGAASVSGVEHGAADAPAGSGPAAHEWVDQRATGASAGAVDADGVPDPQATERIGGRRTLRSAAAVSAVGDSAGSRAVAATPREAGAPGNVPRRRDRASRVRLERKHLLAGGGAAAVLAAVLAGMLLPDDEEPARPRAGTVTTAPPATSGTGVPASSAPKARPGDVAPATSTGVPGRGAIVASGPVPSAQTSDPPSVTPTTTSPTPSVSPTSSPTVSEPPAGKRLVSPGGVAFAVCENGKATLTGWEPAPGYTADPVEPGPALSARVFFAGEKRKYRMTVTCVAGTPTPLVLPL